MINVALTGMVPTRAQSAHVPLTEAEIIEDGIRCLEAGAVSLHLHVRDENEEPCYRADRYAEIITAIRRRFPRAVLCASTSGRIHKEFEKRSEVLGLTGDARPDMGSLTLSSLNFPARASVNEPSMVRDLAQAMLDNGIRPELEVFDSGMVNTARFLQKKGILKDPLFFNLIVGSMHSCQARVSDLVQLRSVLPHGAAWAAGGIGVFQQKANVTAMLMGGHIRVGLEDNLYMDAGKTRPASNIELVERLKRIAAEIGRPLATFEDARRIMLGEGATSDRTGTAAEAPEYVLR
jgi:uncharacterized protein (DUF849 family)